MKTETHPLTLRLDGDTLDWPLYERPLIYVAGYYSANPAHGMSDAIHVAEVLLSAGWLPVIPHLSFLWDVHSPHNPEFWYAYDLGLLQRCDAMYVCGGPRTRDSKGVNDEIVFAIERDIPVFYDVVPASERYEW